MKIDRYKKLLKNVSIRQVSIGYTKIRLFSESELEKAQIGYSFDSKGNDLVGNNQGDWKGTWFVIGDEDLSGDPIFIDLKIEGFPIFTAAHGEGNWNEENIAQSFDKFVEILKLISEFSKDRNTPVLLEKKPLSSEEKRNLLSEIKRMTPNSSTEFWELLLEI